MADVPNTRMLNFVDNPAIVSYSAFGEAQVPLDPSTGNVIDLTGFRTINVCIGAASATSFSVFIGKISGSTLSQEFNRPNNHLIHTFDVTGPQMTVFLKGAPGGSREKVQLWVYLRS